VKTPLTTHDHLMFQHAKMRRKVLVTHGERTALVTLVAWRPVRHDSRRNIARVQYPSGRFASVPLDSITIPEEEQ
jgi:hypothetical protein